MFNRTIIHELEQWKERRDRKPLMILGARQVGKTSVLKKFGEDSFEHCAAGSWSCERCHKHPLLHQD